MHMPARTSAKFTVAVQLEVICWQASWLAGQLIGSPAGGHTLLHIAAPCLMYKRLQTSILVDLRWPRLAISSREFHILQNLTLNYYLSNNTSLQCSIVQPWPHLQSPCVGIEGHQVLTQLSRRRRLNPCDMPARTNPGYARADKSTWDMPTF